MVDYKDTLNLPRTGFEMRANLAQREPEQLRRWQEQALYQQRRAARAGRPRFVMHDGPPYANGHLHHGHILNKILKDMAVKDRTMRGFDSGFIPGWDCHGLPIEVQVDKELGKRKAEMSRVDIRRACRAYAERFVDIQRQEFTRLGVLADWQQPYLTMTFAYEATIMRELGKVAAAGLLYKGLRPVNWCTVHQTALAEAEVEYEDHTSPSIYVALPLETPPPELAGRELDLVIWTTTPWTLPANLAVSLHPEHEYIALPVRGRLRLVARALAPAFLAALGEPAFASEQVAGQWPGRALEGLRYRHPLNDSSRPVVLGEHVTLEAGTGCVHTAPGHGPDDFEVGRRYQLGILSPVDGRGLFTAEAGAFAGQQVFAANTEIIAALVAKGALLNRPDETITHRYAHCWRCHKPIILRATEQWFVAIDKPFNDGPALRQRALTALGQVTWVPPWGEDRIRGMLEARPDWCLSRQRTWGVPIPAFYCESCGTPHLESALIERVAARVEQEGAEAWYLYSPEELVGELRCKECGKTAFRKEEDILDVWFDSGVSFAAVIERLGEGQPEGPPVDLYLEGSDQHRGWFHSSLLCGLATRGQPPFRSVLTHGFVVDGQGKKVSKSKGNYVDPFQAIEKNGAEVLRLWVAGEDYREDIRISKEILQRLNDTYRKVRNTVRYLLGNLYDFDPNRDLLSATALAPLDRYALAVAQRAVSRIMAAYERYEFHAVMYRLVDLCTVELSAFYLDVLKDRLYASAAQSAARRSAQTALYLIVRDLLRVMAPIFSFTAEEAWAQMPRLLGDPQSVHLALYPGVEEPPAVAALRLAVAGEEEVLQERYATAREARRVVNAALEQARQEKRLGSSVEAGVVLSAPPAQLGSLSTLGETELADLFIVSAVTLVPGAALAAKIDRAAGTKCARCWLSRNDVGAASAHPSLCGRCVEAL